MARWSYMLTELLSRKLLDLNVKFTGVEFTDGLMDTIGTFKGNLPVNSRAFSEWVSADQLRRVIWPCRDGVPQGAYLLSALPAVSYSSQVQPVQGVRLDWLFKYRAITKTLTFVNVDQNDIIRDLMRWGMGQMTLFAAPNQWLDDDVRDAAQIPWIVLDSRTSGVQRVRQETTGNTDDGYPATSRKIVAQMVKNLTDLRDESGTRGPEYRWLYRTGADGLPEMVLDTAGPTFTVGRPQDDPSGVISFEPGGRNVALQEATYGSDGTTIVTRGHVVGQKQDTTIPVGMASYTDLMSIGFPLMDKVQSESSVQDSGVLNAKAAGLLWAADDAWALTLKGTGNPAYGSYAIGDWVVLRVRQGNTPKRRSMRITGWTITPSVAGNTETVKPTIQVGKWYG